MAFVSTLVKGTVFGDQRVLHYKVENTTTVSGVIFTGLAKVSSFQWSPISMTTTTKPIIQANASTASAASNGNVYCNVLISGDDFFLTVYGN